MHKRISTFFFLLTALATLFIFSRSLKPAALSREESNFFVNIILNFFNINPDTLSHIIRKIAHCFEFFIQAGCLSAAFLSIGKYCKRIVSVLFCGLFTAVLDEYLQLFAEGRGSMVSDILIDFSGTCIAVILFTVIYFIIDKKYRGKSKETK